MGSWWPTSLVTLWEESVIEFECIECGHTVTPPTEGEPLLPEGFTCPRCGAGEECFVSWGGGPHRVARTPKAPPRKGVSPGARARQPAMAAGARAAVASPPGPAPVVVVSAVAETHASVSVEDAPPPAAAPSPPDLSRCSEPELRLYRDVIAATLRGEGLGFVVPQHSFTDEGGRARRIDFAILTAKSRIAVELDGYRYHAEGAVTREQFADGLQRQNDLILAGWTVLRFSWDQICGEPDRCRATLRRAVISDPELHPILARSAPKPHLIQEEALLAIERSRAAGRKAGLVVLPTGLGKTWLAAFDALRVGGRLLFIVHNNTILQQAMEAFRRVAPEYRVGLFNGNDKRRDADAVFANIATLRMDHHLRSFGRGDFAYVIVDEFHHSVSGHYHRVLTYFQPKFMLGITATPDRTDRRSILGLVGNHLIYEVSQAEAIERGFLAPFRYLALRDNVDYASIRHNGIRYDLRDLNRALLIPSRDDEIIAQYRALTGEARAIAFCVSIEHAKRAAEHFQRAGISAQAIHSDLREDERQRRVEAFRRGEFKVAFVRDLFNEGIDVPEVGALLFMRPTESRTVFIQQLGRGLRLSPGKKGVDVLDFIGNYVHVERIIDHLRSLGAPSSFGNLAEKPRFVFDNGCEIRFERAAVEVILRALHDVARADEIVKDFFLLYGTLGRTPTLQELQSDGRYPLHHHLTRFGSWARFVERVHSVAPELDAASLALPGRFAADSAAEVQAKVAEVAEDLDELLDGVATSVHASFAAFDAIGDLAKRSDGAKALRAAAESLRAALREADVRVGELVFLIEFKGAARTAPPRSPPPSPAQEQAAKAIAMLLAEETARRDAYVFPNFFLAKRGLLAELASAAEALAQGRGDEDDELRRSVAAMAPPAGRALTDLRSQVERLVGLL